MELSPELKAIKDELIVSITGLKSAFQQEIDQIKRNGVADPETKSKIEAFTSRIDGLEALIRKPQGEGENVISKTIGELFAGSNELKESKLILQGRGTARLDVKSFWPDRKTTITTTTIGTAIDRGPRVPGVIMPQLRQLRVRDLLPASRITSGNSVEYVRETSFINAASPQVETVAKAESELNFELKTAPVRTIAHWMPASKQILDDMTALMDYIDLRLKYGLAIKEENEVLNGDGTGQHLNGLINQATAYETSRNVSGDTKIDKLRHALAQARLAEYPVDGIIVNPNDWEAIELVKTEEGGANKGEYVFGNPASSQPFSIWSRRVVETAAIASGTFLVGAFSMGAMIWDRQDAVVDVSTEHADFFTRNMIAIRAEERLALTVFRPGAFVYGAY